MHTLPHATRFLLYVIGFPVEAKVHMVKLFLCRHGQDEDNVNGLLNGHRDMPLTPLGLHQADTVARHIEERHKDAPFDFIFASPLQRAHHTAKAIAARFEQDVIVDPLLIERDFGVLSGRPLSDINQLPEEHILRTEKVNYFLVAEGSETFEACYQRATVLVERLRTEHHGRKVLLVCHGDIGKMILAVCRGISWREGLLHPYIANTEVIEL